MEWFEQTGTGEFSVKSSAYLRILVALFALEAATVLADSQPTPEQVRFFETSIRPLLIEKCDKCHGTDKQWGSLRLDSREALLKGGDSGPAIVPGQPGESRLVQAIQQTDPSLSMPPKEKLTDRQIADVIRWVEMGAPFPATPTSRKSGYRNPNHWSFRPIANPPVPSTRDQEWANNRWDQFVLSKLEEAKLAPVEPADARTIIRRATYDLTGLPPTPVEITEFLADDRPDSFARLVDRLLASPSYGEKWGRHWLDVARYADSNGLDENVAHGNAWRYRDYVVESLNEDLPFNQFVIEQIAGDLLPAEGPEAISRLLTATGFLSLGPKVLAEVDETKMQMDIIDEQVDTVGRAFLGLTLGCARCHDHKFDPIETADYYGLAGIFKSTRTMEHFKKVARWYENPLPSPMIEAARAAGEGKVAAKKAEIQSIIEKADAVGSEAASSAAPSAKEKEAKYSDQTKVELKRLRDELASLEAALPDIPTAMGVKEDTVVDVAIHVRGNPLKLGDVIPRRVPKVVAGETPPEFSTQHSGRLELARWLTDPRHPLTSRVIVNRIWRWHFGKGLVRSPDNFGQLGEAPTHPELLDALAGHFVKHGWSIKKLHRDLMTSSTYRLSSSVSGGFESDPENRLFGHAELRRLDAEELRDGLLSVAGTLDQTLGKSELTVKNRAYFFDHTSKDLTNYESRRRSIYLPVVRNNVYDLFQLLDFPDPAVSSGDRVATTIAPQALLVMNSDFVWQCSAEFADVLRSQSTDDAARIQLAYVRAYGRNPTSEESAASRAYLRDIENEMNRAAKPHANSRDAAWTSLCHVILSSNEFIYLK